MVKLPQTAFVRQYHLVVFKHKCHIGEVFASLLIITKPPMIHDVPRWVARLAEPAGWSSRAGGARAAGQPGQSSSRAVLFDGQGSWTSRAETSTDVLGLKKIPHLSQSERIWPVCLHFKNYLWSILYHFLSSILVLVPPPSCRQEGMDVIASLKVIQTQC